MTDHTALGEVEASASVSANGHVCEFGTERAGGKEACGGPGAVKFGRILLCEQHAKEVEAGGRADHWEEVHLYLDLWLGVAEARENETLSRLLRYARLEARTEQRLEQQAPQSAARNGL